MRVLFIEKTPDGLLDIVMRADRAGHDCRYYLQSYDQRKCPVGRGLVNRVADWRDSVGWADLVVLGSNDLPMLEIERRCAARGVSWIGGTQDSARWETDRLHGMAVMKKAGIDLPPVREFTDYDSAISFIEKRGEPMYCKPCWHGADKALSCKTGVDQDPAFMLKKFKRQTGRPKGAFILQEPIKGTEMGVGAWFGPDGFAHGWEENFEFKRLCAGDLGPNTGEMGTVLRIVDSSKLASKTLALIEDQLARTGFVGNVDIGVIIDQDGQPWPLEFTMRCGWPATNIEQALFDTDFVEFLAALADGTPPRKARRVDEVAVGIVYALPPFPAPVTDYEQIVGVPIHGITPSLVPRLHFAEVMAGTGVPETAGDYVLVATGTGATVVEARRTAERVLKRLSVPQSGFWRNDIGGRLRGQIPTLNDHGFSTEMAYA